MEVCQFDGARGLSTLMSKKVCWGRTTTRTISCNVEWRAPSSVITEPRCNVSLERGRLNGDVMTDLEFFVDLL